MLDKYDVCGMCDPSLYVLSEQLHQIDNDFGPRHIARVHPGISAAWTALMAQVDEMLEGCYVGEMTESLLLFFADKK